MLVKKVPSLYRRRRALVLISSLFGRMVTERIAQVCSTRYKGQGRSSSHHLPSSALSKPSFLSGRTEEVERTTALRALIIARECDKGLEGPPALEAQLLFFELVRYPRLTQSLADYARDKRNTAWIKTTLWPCYDQPTPSFLHPSYCNGVAGEVREVVPETGVPKDT